MIRMNEHRLSRELSPYSSSGASTEEPRYISHRDDGHVEADGPEAISNVSKQETSVSVEEEADEHDTAGEKEEREENREAQQEDQEEPESPLKFLTIHDFDLLQVAILLSRSSLPPDKAQDFASRFTPHQFHPHQSHPSTRMSKSSSSLPCSTSPIDPLLAFPQDHVTTLLS